MKYFRNLGNKFSEKARAFFTVARRNSMSSICEKAGLGLGLGLLFKSSHDIDIDIYFIIIITFLFITSVILATDKEQ